MTQEEFIMKGAKVLLKEGFHGVHNVYSGLNQAFRNHFGKESDPVAVVMAMEKAGKIVTRPSKGGATIYLLENAPKVGADVQATLNAILKD